ncbi:MAG: aldo/keto reductase [Planctomycetota bacterium]|jgi:aryl-alcohol dehydrogenase-like predicted oxidoreductase
MKYARMGDSGLIVSRISFGAMTFTLGNQAMESIYKVGEDLAREMVALALDRGVNFFDTADGYASGESETLLGRVLKERRDDVVISTKYGFRAGEPLVRAGLSRQHTHWAAEQCLKRLGTDRIDLFICHKEDPTTPLEETLTALDDLVTQGKVRYIGYSNWSAWRAAAALEFQKANDLARFITGQMYYSLVGRDVENDTIPMMRHYGVGMMAWSPLAQGFLTGKITPENLKDGDHRLAAFDFLPYDKERGFALVDELKTIAGRKDCSPAQVALAWLLAKPEATSVTIGASKMTHLQDNLGAVDVELGVGELATLDAAMPPPRVYPNWFTDATTDQAHQEALGDPAG